MVMAGSTNSGKTLFGLELLKLNIGADYQRMYCYSEMGQSELRQRVHAINGGDLAGWQSKVDSVECSSGFEGPIANHNPDGLSVIDFLEEVDGEFYRIGADIRSIYDGLGTGVALVLLQKNSQQQYAMGGEATGHKSRLYLTMDIIHQGQSATLVAIKILKAKSYPGRNPNGLEIHCLIERGAVMTPVTEWARLSTQARERARQRYEAMAETVSPPPRAAAPRQAESVVAGVGATPGAVRAAFAAGKTCSGCSCRNRHGLCAITGVYQEPEAMACKHYIRGGGR